jgi:hypothetical protein
MGGLVFSTAFSADGVTYEQINDWNMFVPRLFFLC